MNDEELIEAELRHVVEGWRQRGGMTVPTIITALQCVRDDLIERAEFQELRDHVWPSAPMPPSHPPWWALPLVVACLATGTVLFLVLVLS